MHVRTDSTLPAVDGCSDGSRNHAPRHTFGSALSWAYAMTASQRGVSLVITLIVAAVLGPRDFGLAAMALAYIVLIEMFVAQGMEAAIIQRSDLDDRHLDSVFWIVMIVTPLLTGLAIALSPWWAAVNNLPALAPVISALSLLIPLKALELIPTSLLKRRMEFRSLAIFGSSSALVGGGVGITMAFTGFGVWALVAQHLVTSACTTCTAWIAAGWWPRLQCSLAHARELFGFSGRTLVSQLGVYVSGQSDVILIGLYFGPLALGLYRMADRLIVMILEIATRSVQSVALPHFSSLQDDAERLRASVLSCIRLSAGVTLPLLALIVVSADMLLSQLGEEWLPASGALRVLALMGAMKAITLFTGPLLMARDRPGICAGLIWTLSLATALSITLIGAVMTGAPIDQQITAVGGVRAAAFVMVFGLATPLVLRQLTGIRVRELATTLTPALAASVAAFIFAATAKLALEHVLSPNSWLPAGTSIGVGGLAGGSVLLRFDPAANALAHAMTSRLRMSWRSRSLRMRGMDVPPIGGWQS